MIATRAEVADIFGVAKTTLDSWVKRGCPFVSRGGKGVKSEYDTAAVYTWLTGDGNDLDLNTERAKLTQKQTEKTELQVEQLKSTLTDTEEVKEEWTKYISSCRAKLLSLPTKMASEVLTAETLQQVQDIIKRNVSEALEELAAD